MIDGILASRTDCKECKAVYEKYQKIFFKKIKGKFKQEHPEVARYEKAADYLAKHPDDKDKTKNELQQEQETLLSEIAELKVPLTEVQEDLKKLRDIRYWVRKATPGTEESKEPPKKQPIKEVLQDKTDEKKAQRTAPAQEKHRQQDMELNRHLPFSIRECQVLFLFSRRDRFECIRSCEAVRHNKTGCGVLWNPCRSERDGLLPVP